MSALTPKNFQDARNQLLGLLESFTEGSDPRAVLRDMRDFAGLAAAFCAFVADEFTTSAHPEDVATAILEYVIDPMEEAIEEMMEDDARNPEEDGA